MGLIRLVGLFLIVSGFASGRTYFVAPDGDDRSNGSRGHPFASLQRAEEAVSPGDTVAIRGGTYRMAADEIALTHYGRAHVVHFAKSGTEDKPIRFFAYPGEKPVFDLSDVKPKGLRVYAMHVTGSWRHFRGFAVTGVQVTITGHTQSICFDNQGSHNIFENLEAHDGMAIGFWLGRGSHNLVLNCDAYRNHDTVSEGGRGGNVDGFGYHGGRGTVGNRFVGCRAWYNSDDGFDFISAEESATIENCWAFLNGTNEDGDRLADGNGFKIGGYGAIDAGRLPRSIPRHRVVRSIAAHNRASGFYANHHPGGNDWIHNTAYRNGHNFNMLGRNEENTASVPGRGHVVKNNLAYRGGRDLTNFVREGNEVAGNSFDLELEVSDRHFESLDVKELMAPRPEDGKLPEVEYLKPRRSSRLIDQGIDLGDPHLGKAPDPGAFEVK